MEFLTFLWRITSIHTITYFVIGILSMFLFSYGESYGEGDLSAIMKPIGSPWVMAGPALQVFRGLLFSIILWPFRNVFLIGKNGWLKLWGLFLGLAILGTTGPAPGSIEGMIYTNFPVVDQIIGLRETVFQTLIFSLLIFFWYKKPNKVWNYTSVTMVGLIIMIIIGGLITTTNT